MTYVGGALHIELHPLVSAWREIELTSEASRGIHLLPILVN